MSDLVVYVLVRNDLPSMNPGKAMSQVHHAGVQMVSKYSTYPLVTDYIADGVRQGADHFNTTLVLGANLCQIYNTRIAAESRGYAYGIVSDPSYPFIVPDQELADLIPQDDDVKVIKVLGDGRVLMVRPETTVAWFLGDRDDPEFRDMFAEFSLHP